MITDTFATDCTTCLGQLHVEIYILLWLFFFHPEVIEDPKSISGSTLDDTDDIDEEPQPVHSDQVLFVNMCLYMRG